MTGGGEALLFWLGAPVAVLAALGLIFARKAVHAAIGMVLTMIMLGVFYFAQGADFLGVIQIFVYTGAVMMLFLFVVMLVGVDSADSVVETLKGQRAACAVLILGLGGLLMGAVGRIDIGAEPATKVEQLNAENGNITGMAELIFGRYVWVFEATSALLISAALAAMVLAHRERLGKRPDQRSWSEQRIKSNVNVAGLPAPGVYARHNATDTPALLPDGTPSELSVPRVLSARGQVGSPQEYLAPIPGPARDIPGPARDNPGVARDILDNRNEVGAVGPREEVGGVGSGVEANPANPADRTADRAGDRR